MSTSSLGVSNTSLRSTSLGCSSPSSSITTSLRISSRHDFPFRRLRINLAATSSPVSLWMHFFTTANFPLRKKKKYVTKNSETTNKLFTEIENNKISSNILEQWHFDDVDTFLNNYINMINEECWCFYHCFLCSQLYWIVKILTESTA